MIDEGTIYITKVFYGYGGSHLAPQHILESEEAALEQVRNDLKKYSSGIYGAVRGCVDVYNKQYGEDTWDHIDTLIVE